MVHYYKPGKLVQILRLALCCNVLLKHDVPLCPEIVPFTKRFQLFFKVNILAMLPQLLCPFHFVFSVSLNVAILLSNNLVPVGHSRLVFFHNILCFPITFCCVLASLPDVPSLVDDFLCNTDVLHRVIHFLPHFTLNQYFGTNEGIFIHYFFLHSGEMQPNLDSHAAVRNERYVDLFFVAAEFFLQVFTLDSDNLRRYISEVVRITGRLKIFETCIDTEIPPRHEINKTYSCRWLHALKINFEARRDRLNQ